MPASAVSSIIRAATRSTSVLNILTFPTHERYESVLAKTGHNFYSLSSSETKQWQIKHSPIPSNYHIIKSFDEKIRMPLHLEVDLILSQSRFGQFQTLFPIATQLQVPLINLEHTLPLEEWSAEHKESMVAMRGDINVFISNYSLKRWGFEDRNKSHVIHQGIDTNLFSPDNNVPKKKHILSVVNDWINRDYCCGFYLWKETVGEMPVRVVGDTPGLSESTESVEDLVQEYRSSAIFLNTSTLSPIPMSLLEAMSCGCAVVSTNNCMIPEIIEDGRNGMLANTPEELRSKVTNLLDDEQLALSLGREARQTILDRFSEDRFIDEWNDIFKQAGNMVCTGVRNES